ncbi:hypothetical protein IFM89_000934 [Coptis chinensis]|uniref:BAH domain-containing protein n=1 Tax=Coptis chinensis TaxID=261450 RepID=A0A835IJG1_9MAGN|nr:hypothetical protein IFM89_000934 [Coptis chinensis]
MSPRKSLGSLDFSMSGFDASRDHLSDHTNQIVSNLQSHGSDIFWPDDSWTCSKQLKHYPTFFRNGIQINMHSFVFVMAKEENRYLAYLVDMYEDRKGQKKVRARWFHDNREVARVVTLRNTHSREVFITPHAQVISAECVDGPATVLIPEHYEKYSAVVPHDSSAIINLCSRQFQNNKVNPFDLSRLRGYFNQKILLSLDEVEDLGQECTIKQRAKKTRSSRQRFVTSNSGLRVSAERSPVDASGPTYQNIKFGHLGTRPTAFKYDETQPWPFKVDDSVELLCQDSGIRGCWFKCTILHVSRKQPKVPYDDVQDEDGCGNLEEWILAFRLAARDKLGMRCLGRLTVRPYPPSQDLAKVVFEIGSPVDAVWSYGWWEGVVTGIDNCENDKLQVYFPGEDIFSTFERKNLRISKDWVRNQWVDIERRPDILSAISANVSPVMKLSACSTAAKGTESGSSGISERNVPTFPKLDTVKEDKQELIGSTNCDGLVENMKTVESKKRPRIEDEGEGGLNWNDDQNEEAEDKDVNGVEDKDVNGVEDKDVNGADDKDGGKGKTEEDTVASGPKAKQQFA